MSQRRTGRRAGSPDTRAEIIDSAKTVFAEMGYDRATIRRIAREAGVDPSLIYHYFETKDALFAASIHLPIAPAMLKQAFAVEDEDRGRRLAELFLSAWELDEARESLLGILRSAMGGEDQAMNAFRQFLTSALLEQVAPMIPGENAKLRTELMASHLVGIAITRYVVRLEPIASAPVSQIIELVAPRLQSYLED